MIPYIHTLNANAFSDVEQMGVRAVSGLYEGRENAISAILKKSDLLAIF